MKCYSRFSLAEWLEHLENRHQKEIHLDLTRIKPVAEFLDLLSSPAKIITVAGTNGKGSTVATLESIYRLAGYQVASYTSPHLLSFNERIRINNEPISDEDLCQAFSIIEQGRGDIYLSYFEMATLAALWHFKQKPLDLIILEVGLGGRLDATNIIDSDLAIISTIDLDHQEYLGDTREAIGYEKAGILRSNKPFIYADANPPSTLLNRAKELNCETYLYGQDYNYRLVNNEIELCLDDKIVVLPKPSLHPNSVVAAIMASWLLKKELPISEVHWNQALNSVFLPGRLQVIESTFSTVFDVSHNPQAANYLRQFIAQFQPKHSIYAVFSAFKDKDIPGLIAPLMDCVDQWFPALLKDKRGALREQFDQAFGKFGKSANCYDNALLAYNDACNHAKEGDLIIVYGSFRTVANVMLAREGFCLNKL